MINTTLKSEATKICRLNLYPTTVNAWQNFLFLPELDQEEVWQQRVCDPLDKLTLLRLLLPCNKQVKSSFKNYQPQVDSFKID